MEIRMAEKLNGRRIAILATSGFEQSELVEPQKSLKEAGARVDVVSPKEGRIRGWKIDDWGDEVAVDVPLAKADAEDYDALVLPGGVLNPDQLRTDATAVGFVRSFFEQHKPVAAICHGPWTLVEADVLTGRRVTSYPSIRSDLVNAGAHWEDSEVVEDDGLVTSRKPDDIPAFNRKIIEVVAASRATAHKAA
jgi:protease I